MTGHYNPAAEYNQALESLEAAARAYNEEIERAQKEAQDASDQNNG